MKGRGSYVDAGLMIERWMRDCPDLTDVHLRELLTPIGPWKRGTYDIWHGSSLDQSPQFL